MGVVFNPFTGNFDMIGSGGACGVSGVSGVSGTAGSAGACGVSGVSGVSGTAGSAGACGVSGVSGVAGACGVSGTAGAGGACGVSGISGVTGVPGSNGACGVSGISGVSGVPIANPLASLINLGEGADPATIGLALDEAMSADERYSGIVIAGTAGETIAFGDLCYLDVTATEWLLADADAAATAGPVVLGICVDASTNANATSMLLMGTVRSAAFPASIALGAVLYVGETAGDVQATIPTGADNVIRVVGWAVTAEPNTIYFNPSPEWQITVA